MAILNNQMVTIIHERLKPTGWWAYSDRCGESSWNIPFGKVTVCNGKSPCFIGHSTINGPCSIVFLYVSLEGAQQSIGANPRIWPSLHGDFQDQIRLNDLTLFSRSLESWLILGRSSPFMAQHFRWVDFDNLPRSMMVDAQNNYGLK